MCPVKNVEVCFSTALFEYYANRASHVIIVDILRASTSICTALHNGAKEIIPVSSVEETKKMKEAGYLVAAERDGEILDFADMGNSPQYFTKEKVKNKSIAYSTTNGTKAIQLAKHSKGVIVGSFLNLHAAFSYLEKQNTDVLIFCSGWRKRFNIEDTLFAGALSELLIDTNKFDTNCDSTLASLDIWKLAKNNLTEYAQKISWIKRMNMPEVFSYCFQINTMDIIPYLKNNTLIAD
jgi:2-phosphosulfolactate phosphatase